MSDWSDIGAALRSTRETLGWSLQDVAHRTRIPVQTLHQLEENDYSGFPSSAYAKSFLSQYSADLGIDASDWLDAFETGDVFSNLDTYEYLKDHDEHLGHEPPAKSKRKPKRSRKKAAAQAPAPVTTSSSGAAVLQPLVVFAVTAVMISGAVFGFLHLSKNLAENSDDASNPAAADAKRELQPVTTIPERPIAEQNLDDAPRAVTVPSSATSTPLVVAAEPVDSRSSAPRDPAPSGQPIKAVPPRAIIIEE